MTVAPTSLGQPPEGAPGWLLGLYGLIALLVAVFGAGFGKALLAWLRNVRAGLATRETEAREQERQFRAEHATQEEQHQQRLYDRMRQQLDDQGETIAEQGREIESLKRAQRDQYAREQRIMDGLIAHAGWDFNARSELPHDFPEPPPLLPAADAKHARKWGSALG